MKVLTWLLVPLGLIVLAAFLCSPAKAQDCAQISIDEGDVTCCDGTEQQEDRSCGGHGNPADFCSEGSGECCGTHYGTTNVTYDPEDCTGGGGTGCCPAGKPCVPGVPTCNGSPIVIDTTGRGFDLTSAASGVVFDIVGDGYPVRMGWTHAESGNAFLALDRNNNGMIDNGRELFGNYTSQPQTTNPNGYLALAEFDKRENGGNGDGIIDSRDSVFSELVLWIDENHDGKSQPGELHRLSDLGVYSISLTYRAEPYTDQYGNWFRYKAALNPDPKDGESKDGRWTYDVFFEVGEARTLGRPRTNRERSASSGSDCFARAKFHHLLDDPLDVSWPRSGWSAIPPSEKRDEPGGSK